MRTPLLLLTVLGLGLCPASARAQNVSVPGSKFEFRSEIVETFDNQPVTLRLTGVGLRERFIFNINAYSIASYVDKSASVSSATELAEADVPKLLHLKVERGFKGEKLAEVFEQGIRRNYPGDRFAAELLGFRNYFLTLQVAKDDDVFFYHVPGQGLRFSMRGESEMQIPSVEFSKAVWEIYFGAHPVNEKIKRGLTERL
jgi:hypothetical protein